MAGILTRASQFLKNAWNTEPIIVVSFAFGTTGILGMWLSPITYRQAEEMENMPNAFSYYGLSRQTDRIYEHIPVDPTKKPVWRTDYED